jgi:hypothetical protein
MTSQLFFLSGLHFPKQYRHAGPDKVQRACHKSSVLKPGWPKKWEFWTFDTSWLWVLDHSLHRHTVPALKWCSAWCGDGLDFARVRHPPRLDENSKPGNGFAFSRAVGTGYWQREHGMKEREEVDGRREGGREGGREGQGHMEGGRRWTILLI